jgi:4a-hydroxytetrahydrobiopterin dehydratase
MHMSLSAKTCTPCRGGVEPMSREQARQYLEDLPSWELADDPSRIRRRFRFPDFRQALDFTVAVGELAERENHHPEIALGWGHVTVEIWTHKIKGLHENDFILAAKIDELTG